MLLSVLSVPPLGIFDFFVIGSLMDLGGEVVQDNRVPNSVHQGAVNYNTKLQIRVGYLLVSN